ncbi:hypothetical protein MRB53_004101 [Persea americana]|uniref:Uncharacterized protein n=1 Tax=Persea americana TaxID=3435 RepID=A0ACC2MZW9_PERAE|nr:hypothetical protein MRB53_004101 [Persea americana]
MFRVSRIHGGIIDGKGMSLWAFKASGNHCPDGAESLTFTNAKDVVISGLTSMNSQLYHIVIDGCTNVLVQGVKNSGVKISQVTYSDIQGTSASQVDLKFDCSATHPCSGIELQDVRLTYQNHQPLASCKNADGTATGLVEPPCCF